MKIIKYLSDFNGKIVIVLHSSPDPDCVGSALALYHFLKKLNKDVLIISKDEPPRNVDFLKGFDNIIVSNEIINGDLYILVDQSEVKRSGFEIDSKNVIKIDHHISNVVYSEYDFVREDAPSTTSLILELIRDYDESLIDEEIAECIFVGLMSDTGNFSYSNLKEAFSYALYLANRGFNLSKFSEKYMRNNSINRMKLIQIALSTLAYEGEIAYIIIRKNFYELSGAKKYENFGIVDYPFSLKGVKVALKFEEMNNSTWKVNLRSRIGVNVELFARQFGGGGHENAAAFRIRGSENEIIEKVIHQLKQYLKSS